MLANQTEDRGPVRRRDATAEKLLFTPEQAADMLGLGRTKLYELLATGDLRSVRIGACRRIPSSVLHDFVGRLLAEADASAPPSIGRSVL
jgi:excisionase family DNA binding protein